MNLEEYIRKQGWPKYRLKQIRKAREQELVSSWDELTTLSKEHRKLLTKNIPFDSLNIKEEIPSKDNSAIKFLLETNKAHLVETVLLIHQTDSKKWGTVCISSQVGCPLACKFCATGAMGFKQNLSTQEILDQYLIASRRAAKLGIQKPNIVLMGMGEPLLNMDNLLPALKIFINKDRIALSNRKITLSTSGFVPAIEKLLNQDIKVRLAISLHAADNKLRDKIMPINKSFPLEKLMKILDLWTEKTNKQIFYEYLLIKDINDSKEEAKKLAALLKNRLAKINLIPYNPTSHQPDWQRSPIEKIREFKKVLDDVGIPATIRHTKGDEIAAACGQLTVSKNQN